MCIGGTKMEKWVWAIQLEVGIKMGQARKNQLGRATSGFLLFIFFNNEKKEIKIPT